MAFSAAFVLVAAGLIVYSQPGNPGGEEALVAGSRREVCTQNDGGTGRPEADCDADVLRDSASSNGALQEMMQEQSRLPVRSTSRTGTDDEGSDRVELLALNSRHVV